MHDNALDYGRCRLRPVEISILKAPSRRRCPSVLLLFFHPPPPAIRSASSDRHKCALRPNGLSRAVCPERLLIQLARAFQSRGRPRDHPLRLTSAHCAYVHLLNRQDLLRLVSDSIDTALKRVSFHMYLRVESGKHKGLRLTDVQLCSTDEKAPGDFHVTLYHFKI